MVFWHKVESHSNFKLCSSEYWEISKNINSDDEDEPYNEHKLRPKKIWQQLMSRNLNGKNKCI